MNKISVVAADAQKRPAHVRVGSFSTEAANSAARPRSASPQKLTSGANEKLVAMGQSLQLRAAAIVPYSITSSASATSVFGRVRPSALAVLRLITSSNLVGR